MRLTDAELAAQRGPFAGHPGQLDAPFRKTPTAAIERMLDLALVGPGTRLFDLGCGDGRIVIAAARRGADARGIDIDPHRIAQARAAAMLAGVEGSARFEQGDMFAADLAQADVVTLFLLSHVNRWLQTKLRGELRTGARIVSYTFPMAGWEPAAAERHGNTTIYVWTF